MLTSQKEGAETVVLESLSCGTPVVMFENSTCIPNFYRNFSGVFMIPKRNIKEFSNKINEIMDMNKDEYLKLSKKIINESKNKLTMEIFIKKWKKILKKI